MTDNEIANRAMDKLIDHAYRCGFRDRLAVEAARFNQTLDDAQREGIEVIVVVADDGRLRVGFGE